MWEFIKKLFGVREPERSRQFMANDPEIIEGEALISGAVVSQLQEAGFSNPASWKMMRSFILGYVATLGEQYGEHINDTNGSAGALLAIRVAHALVGPSNDTGKLFQEFNDLTAGRDFGFGQGGAVGLEDFPVLMRRGKPSGLLNALR